MIEGHERFTMQDRAGKNDWFIDVNWNPGDSDTNQCKVLKITFPGGKQAFLKREHLHAVLFAIGNSEEQMNLIPQRITTIRQYKGLVRLKAKRDIFKGEDIIAPINLSLPVDEKEVLGAVKNKNKLIPVHMGAITK